MLVSEWLPTTLSVATLSFFVLLVGAGWLLGRAHMALTRFEWLALAVTGLAGLDAVRNVGYFALAALMLLPAALDRAWPARPSKSGRWPDAVVAVAALAAVGVMAVNVLGHRAGALVGSNNPAAAAAVAKAVREAPGSKVFADVHYADWLTWAQPSLAGRIAFDARFELLHRGSSPRSPRSTTRAGVGVRHLPATQSSFSTVPTTASRWMLSIEIRERRCSSQIRNWSCSNGANAIPSRTVDYFALIHSGEGRRLGLRRR